MIIGRVITNLDKFKGEIWPTVFVEVPKIGSYIQSKTGVILTVTNIIHCPPILENDDNPYIKIEVHN